MSQKEVEAMLTCEGGCGLEFDELLVITDPKTGKTKSVCWWCCPEDQRPKYSQKSKTEAA